MKKSEQTAINAIVEDALSRFESDRIALGHNAFYLDEDWTRLRSCSAEVAHVGKWYILCSYRTIVALIDTETDTCYDFLRYVYGYTSTSAQHIAKFRHDYGRKCDPVTGECQWGCAHEYMWKAV